MIDKNESDILVPLGKHIRRLRKAKGFTQDVMAERAGIAQSDISKIEGGQINLSFTTLYKLATGLEVKVKDLVDF
jgi:transcriptional regulator with XRE-family HTH domain